VGWDLILWEMLGPEKIVGNFKNVVFQVTLWFEIRGGIQIA
jgi:hypothetical protein